MKKTFTGVVVSDKADKTANTGPPVARRAAALLILAGLIAACSAGESPAFKAYKAFVSATIRGDCDTLYGLAEKDAIAFVDEILTPAHERERFSVAY